VDVSVRKVFNWGFYSNIVGRGFTQSSPVCCTLAAFDLSIRDCTNANFVPPEREVCLIMSVYILCLEGYYMPYASDLLPPLSGLNYALSLVSDSISRLEI
jgi:hypothetical protein